MKLVSTQAILSFVTAMAATPSWGAAASSLRKLVPAPGDSCSGAIPIAVGTTVPGSTSTATADAGIGTCVTTYDGSPGVWYTVTGTGAFLEANTCGDGTNYNTKLHVYSGPCGSLTCIAGNNNDASCGSDRSRVSWYANPSVVYYIFVHGYRGERGSFELQLQCNADTTPPQVLCEPGVNPGGEEPDPDSNSRFYKLVGLDDCSEPALYVRDTVSGTEFGPFESGTYIKYVAAKGHIMPSMIEMNGDVDYFMIKGKGPVEVVAVDGAGKNATTLCA